MKQPCEIRFSLLFQFIFEETEAQDGLWLSHSTCCRIFKSRSTHSKSVLPLLPCFISEREVGFGNECSASRVKMVFLLGWTLVTTTCARSLLLFQENTGEHEEGPEARMARSLGTNTKNSQKNQDLDVWRKEDTERNSWHLDMFYGLPAGRIRFVLCSFRRQE